MSEVSPWACPSCNQGMGFLYCLCDKPAGLIHGSHYDPCFDAECECGWKGCLPTTPDPRDAELATLREQLAAHETALRAIYPAVKRAFVAPDENGRSINEVPPSAQTRIKGVLRDIIGPVLGCIPGCMCQECVKP